MELADPLCGTTRLYVEWKHSNTDVVDLQAVQVVHSANVANPELDEGIIVTAGRFSDDAKAYAHQVGVVQLVHRARLRELSAGAGM